MNKKVVKTVALAALMLTPALGWGADDNLLAQGSSNIVDIITGSWMTNIAILSIALGGIMMARGTAGHWGPVLINWSIVFGVVFSAAALINTLWGASAGMAF